MITITALKQINYIIEYFVNLSPVLIDQTKPTYNKSTPFSIGAHLAHVLDCTNVKLPYFPTDNYEEDYERGSAQLAYLLNMTAGELDVHLWWCGANRAPWSIHKWPVPPYIVFQRLKEKLRE